jgi:hypothetical protein
MHIAQIDFQEFYGPAFGGRNEVAEFVSCVRKIPASVCPAKIVIHQAARMIWLADRIEECAASRPALQIMFFMIAAEAAAKLVEGYDGEGESKYHARFFFSDICSSEHRNLLSQAFSRDLSNDFLTYEEAVDFLYNIRCDVVHRGRYFEFLLKSEKYALPISNLVDDQLLVAHITARQLRQVVLEGALLGALQVLPKDSDCRALLEL